MEATFPTEAIILDRYYFKEYDSRIVVYSPDYGKMDLIVRGTRRAKSKLSGHIEPISLASLMVVKGKQYNYIGSARGIDAFSRLKDNFETLVSAGKAIKIFKRLVEPGELDLNLYNMLKNYLLAVDKKDLSETEGNLLYYIFIFKFISELGYRPELSVCSKCKKTKSDNDYFFNYISGGLLCKYCAEGQKNNLLISSQAISLLRRCEKVNFGNFQKSDLSEQSVDEFKKVLGVYVRYNLEFEI